MIESVVKMIQQYMANLGYTDFFWEPVRVKTSAVTITIDAYNEYYFLLSKSVPADLQIVSDNELMTAEDSLAYSNFNLYGNAKGFSGQVIITQGPAVDHEFIRVIPIIKQET